MTSFTVVLRGGSPWGFRIKGGREFNEPITVSKINPNSKAYNEGIKVGDAVLEINEQRTNGLNYTDAQQLIKNSTEQLFLQLSRNEKSPNIHFNGDIADRSVFDSSSKSKPHVINTGDSFSPYAADLSGTSNTTNTSSSINYTTSPFTTAHSSGPTSAMASMHRSTNSDFGDTSTESPRYKGFIRVPTLSPTLPHARTTSEIHRSDQEHYDMATPPSPKWSKRPILQPASPKPLTLRHSTPKPLPLYHSQPVSNLRAQGAPHSPRSGHTQSFSQSSSLGRRSSSPGDVRSKGMSLFRRQQEKLAQLGADVQEISVNESPRRNFESHPVLSAHSSPGGTGHHLPFRSLSTDENVHNVPIIVKPPFSSVQSDISHSRRARSISENADTHYHVQPAHDFGLSSWQNGLPDPSQRGRNFAVGSYATLPIKSSSAHYKGFVPPSSAAPEVPSIASAQFLSFDTDQQAVNDFDHHAYSTLPTIRPLRSHNRQVPLDLPELEKETKFRDYSKPLWANTDVYFTQQSGDDNRSPPSDNAVSSSDSRDTIIAKSDETKHSEREQNPLSQSNLSELKPDTVPQPKMIPVRVVHEESEMKPNIPDRTPAFDKGLGYEPSDQPWGKRVVEGADHSFSNLTSERARVSQEKPADLQVNGIRSPSIFPPSKPGVWSPGISPSSSKTDLVQKSQGPSSPPESSLKNIAPVWKPGGSPGGVRKEYKPVRLNTIIKPAERKVQQQDTALKPQESFAWKPTRPSDSQDISKLPTSSLSYTPLSPTSGTVFKEAQPTISMASSVKDHFHDLNGNHGLGSSSHLRTNGSVSDSVFDDLKDTELHLPSTQSPYITLLQKSRENESHGDLNFNHIGKKPIMVNSEGQIPKGAQYLFEKVTVDGDKINTDTYYSVPTEEKTTTAKTVEVKPVVYEGIGPLDSEGVPLAFRKNIEEKNQKDWYRQMYKSLHRTEKKEDQLGINDMIDTIFEKAEENKYQPTYKFPDDISDTKSEEDVNPYWASYEKSSSLKDDSGYRSEPEGKYKNLFRRSKSTSDKELREARRNLWVPPSVRSKIEVYRNQPRSIVDYEPGFSSIALREAKTRRPRSYSEHTLQNRKKKGNQFNPPIDKPGQFSQYSIGGVRQTAESDIRQSGDGEDPRDMYRKVQSGGEIPQRGLQKAVPDKPRASEPPVPPPPSQSALLTPSSATFPRSNAPATKNRQQQAKAENPVSPPTSRLTPRSSSSPGSASAPAPPTRGGSGVVKGIVKVSQSKAPVPYTSNLSAAEQLGVQSPPPSSSLGSLSYASNQSPAARVFKHPTSDVRRQQAPNPEKEKKRREEEDAYRKKRLEELYEEERQKKIKKDEIDAENRRHHDFFPEAQKSPISPNRYDDVQVKSRVPVVRKEELSVPPERRRGFQLQGKARALHNFTAQNPRELSFRKNDILFLLRQVDKNWFEGERHGLVGIFPVNYVEVVTSIEAAQAAAMQAEGQARAKYNFTAQSSVELTIRKGEFVVLLRRIDENWFEGRIGLRQGIFPVNYVEVIREPSTPLITPAPSVITTPMTGTPEMLSPVSYDAAPTPPPQPSPSAFLSQRSPSAPYGYRQPQQQGQGGHPLSTSLLAPAPNVSRSQINFSRQQQEPEFGEQRINSKSPLSPPQASKMGSPGQGKRVSPLHSAPSPLSRLQVDIHPKSFTNGQMPPNKGADDDLVLTRYHALYAYRPQNEDELELKEGDEVFVMEKCDDGWFVGTSARTGSFGTFPGNYVQKI